MGKSFLKHSMPLLILEILKNHTDEEHGLKITQIVDLLASEYGITTERKAVSRVLNDLQKVSEIPESFDWKNPVAFSILCDVTPRSTGDIRDNWRVCKEFEDAELRLLLDAVSTMDNYSADRLAEKLIKQGSRTLQENIRFSAMKKSSKGVNLPLNVHVVNQAITEGKQLSFHYACRNRDKKWQLCRGDREKPLLYTVSPYQMAFRNGHYYLICEDRGVLSSYRIDRIRDGQVLAVPAVPYRNVAGAAGWRLDLKKYLDQHIEMCEGAVTCVTFRMPESMVSDVLDLFGERIDLIGASDGNITVRAEVNRNAMVRFAKANAPDVKVLAPADLVQEVKQALQKAAMGYQ